MKKIKTYISNLPKGTKWVVGMNVSIYIVTILLSLFFGFHLQDYLGAYPMYSENFTILTILTSMFTHSMNITHIISNMLLLLIFAPFVENKLGTKNFIISYFFMGVIGYLSINYPYQVNKLNITKSIQKVGLDVSDIKVTNGKVSDKYLSSLTTNQSTVVKDYNYVISKTYGASSSLFGVIFLYLLFGLLNIKKLLFNVLATLLIVAATFEVFYHHHILNGSHFAHLGGVVGGLVVFIVYKTKKGII